MQEEGEEGRGGGGGGAVSKKRKRGHAEIIIPDKICHLDGIRDFTGKHRYITKQNLTEEKKKSRRKNRRKKKGNFFS